MNAKDFLAKFKSCYVWGNLLAMAVVLALLGAGVKYGLDLYTHHGEGIVVPKIKGMSSQKARLLLDEKGLLLVVTDSGYNKALPADCILAQSPGFGTKVKEGHVIYVTVNSPSSPSFIIPDIVDNASLREAEAKLLALGFRLLPAQKVKGEKDWVYGILCRGRHVANGERVSIDYPLVLQVGAGNYDDSEDYSYDEPTYDGDATGGDDGGQLSGLPDESGINDF